MIAFPALLHGSPWLGFENFGWWIGLVANVTIAAAFLAVAALLAVNAIRTRQVKNNPLGLAVVVLYVTCGGGHVVHALQLLDGPLGLNPAIAAAAAFEYTSEWHMWAVDVVTMIAGVAYWMTRARFPALVSGAAVFEDLRGRQRRALEVHDDIVQGIVRAKLALELKQGEEGQQAVEETLEHARGIITRMLGDRDLKPGALRRKRAGGGSDGL